MGIVLSQAHFCYGPQVVLRGAELSVQKGQSFVVTGPNGAGKSTLLYACAGITPLLSGSLSLGGHVVDPSRPEELIRRNVRCGVVFQEGGLISNMNALANVALPLRYHADSLGLTLQDVEERAEAALGRVGIRSQDFFSLPAHLSFGVRKRLAFARALAFKPNYFFFDDPDVGLDRDTAAKLHEILCQYRDDPEVTMLVATNRELLVEHLQVPNLRLEQGRVFVRPSALA